MKPSFYMFKIGIKNSCDICCDLNGTTVLQKGRSIEKKISLLCSNFVQQFVHMPLHVILLNSHEHPGHTYCYSQTLIYVSLCVGEKWEIQGLPLFTKFSRKNSSDK